MRYLLLSVLVVCVIGIMIPSVFAEEPCYAGPVENIPPGGLPCFSPYMDDPPTPEERCKMKDECMIKVTTDKQIYQSDETIKITVELIGMDYFGEEYHPMSIRLADDRDRVGYEYTSCILTNTVSGKESLCSSGRSDFYDGKARAWDNIRVNEPLTFEIEPPMIDLEVEYRVGVTFSWDYLEDAGGNNKRGAVLILDDSKSFTVLPYEKCLDGKILDGVCVVEEKSEGGGCLIATATFGSEMAPQVQFLRELRDNTVLQTESGSAFMIGFNQFYYSFSPAVADYERENPTFKEAVKITLTPLLTSLTLLQYADIDSESEMLGYGIGVILLNIGMYFVVPAVLIMTVRKKI